MSDVSGVVVGRHGAGQRVLPVPESVFRAPHTLQQRLNFLSGALVLQIVRYPNARNAQSGEQGGVELERWFSRAMRA